MQRISLIIFRQPKIIGVNTSFSEDLRHRIDEELKHFNEAFAATREAETSQNLEDLVDAADRLMRAIARALIEAKRQLGD